MKMPDPLQLTGLAETHLVEMPGGHRLQAEAAAALGRLQEDACRAGFQLAIASSFRSFERQLLIWNAKARGERPVHDDRGREVDLAGLTPGEQLRAILRYTAVPGASRHHWGTDLDVYDAAALGEGERVELTPGEVAPGGVFDPLHRWLDERMAAGESHGFYRPYARDRGGVAPERWHLSYAPLSVACGRRFGAALLRRSWALGIPAGGLMLQAEIEQSLPEILRRYVCVEETWCPVAWRT